MKRSTSKAKAPRRRRSRAGGRVLDANKATFEQLRDLGMSVTQATRVIAYRERAEGFKTVDDMDTIPGFTKDKLDELKKKLTA